MAKTLIWIITVVGLSPAALLAWYSFILMRLSRRWGTRYSGHVFIHDSYVSLCRHQLSITPQYWSLILLIAGIVMVIVALFAILRSSAA